jgi:hypothetical protein
LEASVNALGPFTTDGSDAGIALELDYAEYTDPEYGDSQVHRLGLPLMVLKQGGEGSVVVAGWPLAVPRIRGRHGDDPLFSFGRYRFRRRTRGLSVFLRRRFAIPRRARDPDRIENSREARPAFLLQHGCDVFPKLLV